MNRPDRDIGSVRVVQVAVDRVLDLRRKVLRNGTATSDPRYAEDQLVDTVHLAVESQGVVVATSTWLPRPAQSSPEVAAYQLKGMAVDDALQGGGMGSLLLAAGIERAVDSGARIVWARARDSALGFYERHGFDVVGQAFVDELTGLSHHIVEKRLD